MADPTTQPTDPAAQAPDIAQIVQMAREAALQTATTFLESRRQANLPSAAADPRRPATPAPGNPIHLERRETRHVSTPAVPIKPIPPGQMEMLPTGEAPEGLTGYTYVFVPGFGSPDCHYFNRYVNGILTEVDYQQTDGTPKMPDPEIWGSNLYS